MGTYLVQHDERERGSEALKVAFQLDPVRLSGLFEAYLRSTWVFWGLFEASHFWLIAGQLFRPLYICVYIYIHIFVLFIHYIIHIL